MGLFAQPVSRTIKRDAWIRVTQSFQQGDSVLAILEGADNLGLTEGQVAKAFQAETDAVPGISPKRSYGEIGSGYILLHEGKPAAFLQMYHSGDSLFDGDMVQVKLSLPDLPYRSLFSDLALNNLIFTNADKEPLFSLEHLIRKDSRPVEDSVFRVILDDLHSTYEQVKDRPDLPEVLLTPIKAGRFSGRTPMMVLRDATKEDITAFFRYVQAYPAGYMSKKFRASESIAGWLVSNSPYSVGEIRDALLPYYKNKAELVKRAQKYKSDILRENSVSHIADEAAELSAKSRVAEALQMAEFAVNLAEAINDTVAKPNVYISMAQIYLDQEKYPEAISWCDKSVKASQLAKDRYTEIQATIKKGFCYGKISRNREAEDMYQQAVKKLEQYRSSLEPNDYYNGLRRIFEYRAALVYRNGQYGETLRLLDSVIAYNQKINSYEARSSSAGYYIFIGKVCNSQGRPDDALQVLGQAEKLFRDNLEWQNVGIAKNEMSLSYFKQGQYRRSIQTAEEAWRILKSEDDLSNMGYSKSMMGTSYQQLGDYDSAVICHLASVALRHQAGDLDGEAYSLYKLGELYKESGSKKKSLEAYDAALAIYRQLKDSASIADVYNEKGSVYLQDENYKKAADWLEMARGISSKSTVEATYRLGLAWHMIDTSRARKYYLEALQKSRRDDNTGYSFYISRMLALMAYRSQDWATGDQYYADCERLSGEIKTAYSRALCLSLKAARFEADTQLDSALVYYYKSLAITDTADKSEAISNLNDIATVYMSKGEFLKSDEALTRAMQIARDISDSLSLATTLQNVTFLKSLTAEFDKGLAQSDTAVQILVKADLKVRLAACYSSRGTLLSGMGANREAVKAYLYADSLYRSESLEMEGSVLYNNIGIIYTNQGDYNTAMRYLQKALQSQRKGLVNETYLLTQGNVAECLVGQKKFSEAKTLLLSIFPKTQQLKLNRVASGMALVLGNIYYEEKALPQATEYYTYARNYAMASGEQEKMIGALTGLARVYNLDKKPEEARSSLLQSVELTRRYHIISAWEPYYELGLFYYNNQQPDSAIAYFRQAVDLLDKNAENLYGGEEARKIFDNDPRKADLYNKIIFSYYNTGNIREAWAYANRSNIAGIKELSGSLSVNSSDEEKSEALRKLLAMQQTRKALETTLDKQSGTDRQETLKKIEILEADYNNFLQDVVEQYPELSTYFSRSNADEFNNYKGKLPGDLAVALYLVNDKTLMIFTLTNEKLAVDTMTLDIAPRVVTFIETIRNTNKQTGTGPLSERSEPQDEENPNTGVEFKDISDELYRALIATVEDKIGQKKKLCIIPTGIFSNMPFQCLGRKENNGGFRFLIEDHQVFYTNKMSVFNTPARTQNEKPPLSSFAAFGVPDASLRYNITEVKAIGRILGADTAVYTDKATESRAKQSLRNKQYIHFATHGVLNYSSDYSQSYLKLLPDKDTSDGNNGQLTMREVQKLGITDCEMVILSACQTAVSKQLVKGWSISPANSFLVSKVKSVVASLWKVADEPTELLMEYFYENLNKNMDKVEALRQAQIRLSQDPRYRHPNYWGAFVLYGEWR